MIENEIVQERKRETLCEKERQRLDVYCMGERERKRKRQTVCEREIERDCFAYVREKEKD